MRPIQANSQKKWRSRLALLGLAGTICAASVYARFGNDLASIAERLVPNNKAVFAIAEPLNELRYGKKVGEANIDVTCDGIPDHIIQRGQRGLYNGTVMFKDGKDNGPFGTYKQWHFNPFICRIAQLDDVTGDAYLKEQDFPWEAMYQEKQK